MEMGTIVAVVVVAGNCRCSNSSCNSRSSRNRSNDEHDTDNRTNDDSNDGYGNGDATKTTAIAEIMTKAIATPTAMVATTAAHTTKN